MVWESNLKPKRPTFNGDTQWVMHIKTQKEKHTTCTLEANCFSFQKNQKRE